MLDIDGVILAGRHWRAEKRERLPADTIAILNEVCAKSGAIVVVSSVWRSDNRLRGRLRRAGFTGRFHKAWRTSDLARRPVGSALFRMTIRGDEIADWVALHRPDRYAIVDDDSDMLPGQVACFVKTEFENGLTPSIRPYVAG